VELLSALLAVGALYIAYLNYVILKRGWTGSHDRSVRLVGRRAFVTMILYAVAACLFIVSAITSSTNALVFGALTIAAGVLIRQFLRFFR
jgi:hypothetical protein